MCVVVWFECSDRFFVNVFECVFGESEKVCVVFVIRISVDTYIERTVVALNLCHIKSGITIFPDYDKIPYTTSAVAFVGVSLVVFDILNTVIVQEIIYVRVIRCVLATRE